MGGYNGAVIAVHPLARLARRAAPVPATGAELQVIEAFATGVLGRGMATASFPTGVALAFTAGAHRGHLVVDSCWRDIDGAHAYYAIRYVEVPAELAACLERAPIPKDVGRWTVAWPAET
jgi:hypothetical protein